MSDRTSRLPGQGHRPTDQDHVETLPKRSWEELIQTLQGGIGIVNDDCQLTFVSDRFLSLLGSPKNLVGQDLRQLVPTLNEDDPRRLLEQIATGQRVEFEQQYVTATGDRSWHRITIVPCSDIGSGLVAVVFAKDITETSEKLAQLREAAVRLTEVETELYRRVGRDVHDGAVQLLAALIFRLGMSKADEAVDLQRLVSDVSSTLRQVVEEFSPESSPTQEELLAQWAETLLAASGVTLLVNDQRAAESGLAETQAAFVMIYQAIRDAGAHDGGRTFNADLADERGGERITLRSPSPRPAVLSGIRGARLRSCSYHAQALGGTLETWIDGGIRYISMWIPKLSKPSLLPLVVDTVPEVSKLTPGSDNSDVLAQLPPLEDSAWTRLVSGCPERIIEFDRDMCITFANAAQEQTIGVRPDQLIGVSIADLFTDAALSELNETFALVELGHHAETDWQRENAHGDRRLAHVSISPRLGEQGQWRGMLVATDDQTDIELLDDMYQTALADLMLASRRTTEASVERLEQPLADCERLIESEDRFAAALDRPGPVHEIMNELATALRKVRSSTSVLGPHESPSLQLEEGLANSLGSILNGRQLTVRDRTNPPPVPAVADAIFRIAREAANNAVLHGSAILVDVTLTNEADGICCTITDNGVGFDLDLDDQDPLGSLGIRMTRERAVERGGTFDIEQNRESGTVVTVWLPNRVDRPSLLSSGFGTR